MASYRSLPTVEGIERAVEHQTDALDRLFLTTDMTEDEHKRRIDAIKKWAERQYRLVVPE